MADDVRRFRPDAVVAHLVTDFRYQTMTKAKARDGIGRLLLKVHFKTITIRDFRLTDVSLEKGQAQAEFVAAATWEDAGKPSHLPLLCKTTFVREQDGRWRVRAFRLYSPITDQELRLPLP